MTCTSRVRAILVALAIAALAFPASASDNRLMLASQSDFGAKRGFYLDFENSAAGDAKPKLATLTMILAVGDGKNWEFLSYTPAWQVNHDYHVRAVIAPSGNQLWLDGKKIKTGTTHLAPDTTDVLTAGSMPSWANAPAEYMILEKSLTLTPLGGKTLTAPLKDLTQIDPKLLLFDPESPAEMSFRADPSRTLIVDSVFRIVLRPTNLKDVSPMIDRYGQAVASKFPTKITSDAQLKESAKSEARHEAPWRAPANRDKYGGATNLGWHMAATGYFRTTRRDGKWWLVTPLGNPCFYTGLDTAPALTWDQTPVTGREFLWESLPPKSGESAAAWGSNPWGSDPGIAYFAPHAANMLRKYGANWQSVEKALTAKRLRLWGFSGLGKWCDPLPGVPDLPVLHLANVPKIARHPDIFDPAIQAAIKKSLTAQIAPRRDDPLVVGWSIGNEYDEIITPDEIKDILAKPGASPAKTALLAEAKAHNAASNPAKLSDSDIDRLRQFYAKRYYSFLYKTVKAIDPHHLYFGFWISVGWWVSSDDWRLIAPYCDVIGYDYYSTDFADKSLANLMRETDKPVLCGEFSLPPQYGGERGFGRYQVASADDADAGSGYQRWAAEGAKNPYCVGVCWFQYRDEPLTGRGPGHGPNLVYGEDFAFGMVDVTDTPKWGLVDKVRKANLAVIGQRMAR